MPVNRTVFDESISDALDLLRLTDAERNKAFAALKKMESRLKAIMSDEEIANLGKRDLANLLKQANVEIDIAFDDIADNVEIGEIAKVFARKAAVALEIGLGIDAINMPRQDYFDTLASDLLIMGAPSADWWNGQSVALQNKFAQQVRIGAASGETNQQIIQRIVGKRNEPGIMDTSRAHASSLVHTSLQTVAAAARRKTWKANSDLVIGFAQVSTLDGHTTLICISYSGEEWDLDLKPLKGSVLPFNGGVPRHWFCRSVEVPITKSFKELGINSKEFNMTTRASSDGQIKADTSFDDYLRRKGEAFQNEVLGEGRAELWRNGDISLKDLVDNKGRPLTLAQLNEKVNASFSGAKFGQQRDVDGLTVADILKDFPANTQEKINDVTLKLGALEATNETFGFNGSYSEERLDLHNKILYEGVEGFDPKTGKTKFYPGVLSEAKVKSAIPSSGDPTFTILGGRGGSGKSSFNGAKFPEAKVYDEDKAIVFDSDVIKHMLPEFKGFNANQVHEESSDILSRAILEAKEFGANTVLDGTLRSKNKAEQFISLFKEAGYKTEVHYMHLPRKQASQRAVARFLGPTGRYVPVEVILGNTTNEANFDALRKIVDKWSFRDNDVDFGKPPILIAKGEK